MKEDRNTLLTQVGPDTPMGDYLRRYWHPISGASEFDDMSVKPIRLFGENLVLYKDLSGNYGLIERHCPHRSADLAFGYVEETGLRCAYHGWQFAPSGQCLHQPYEEVIDPAAKLRTRTKAKAYPVREKAGLLWAYMGPQPAPEIPDWEIFNYANGFSQIIFAELPCNWFQCQENTMDPIHFEWTHNNWTNRNIDPAAKNVPTHLKIEFEEFEHGFIYRRLREGEDQDHPQWAVGRVSLWPNGFYLGHHFEWRVPIDDETTLNVLWMFHRVPKECEPYRQESIPAWYGPLHDEEGKWITSHIANQDFAMWAGQGKITDRTRENLGASDRGIAMMRRRFFDELKAVEAGHQPKALITDPENNHNLYLPSCVRDEIIAGMPREEQERHQLLGPYLLDNPQQYGQPESVRKAYEAAIQRKLKGSAHFIVNAPLETEEA